jgi:hypothetical protein
LDHRQNIKFKKVAIENVPGIVNYLLEEYEEEMKQK